MKTLQCLVTLFACVLLAGCAGDSTPTAPPPPPPANLNTISNLSHDLIRAGDKITIRLTGVPDGEYLIEIQVPTTGEVTVPLLTRSFRAAGRNAADLAAEISSAYKTDKIYTNPHITVLTEERFVNVGGDVRSPSRVQYTPDLTLLSTINSCGGFDEYADRHHVRILRGQQIIITDCVAAQKNPGADPAVYPGDQIYVPRTIF